MTFTWDEYLKLAKEMAGQSTPTAGPEARLRSSVSRAYYAAFCQARNYLVQKKQFVVPQSDPHKAVINEFKKIGSNTNPLPLSIAANLHRLKLNRRMADYDDFVAGLQHVTSFSILLSSDTLDYLSKI